MEKPFLVSRRCMFQSWNHGTGHPWSGVTSGSVGDGQQNRQEEFGKLDYHWLSSAAAKKGLVWSSQPRLQESIEPEEMSPARSV